MVSPVSAATPPSDNDDPHDSESWNCNPPNETNCFIYIRDKTIYDDYYESQLMPNGSRKYHPKDLRRLIGPRYAQFRVYFFKNQRFYFSKSTQENIIKQMREHNWLDGKLSETGMKCVNAIVKDHGMADDPDDVVRLCYLVKLKQFCDRKGRGWKKRGNICYDERGRASFREIGSDNHEKMEAELIARLDEICMKDGPHRVLKVIAERSEYWKNKWPPIKIEQLDDSGRLIKRPMGS